MIPLKTSTCPEIQAICQSIQDASAHALYILSVILPEDQDDAESSKRITLLYDQVNLMLQRVQDLCQRKKFDSLRVSRLRNNVLIVQSQSKCEYREISPNKFRLKFEPGPDLERAIQDICEIAKLELPSIRQKKIVKSRDIFPDIFEEFQNLLSHSFARLSGNLKSLIGTRENAPGDRFLFVPVVRLENLAELKKSISLIFPEVQKKIGDRSGTFENYLRDWDRLDQSSASALAHFMERVNSGFQKIVSELFDSYFVEIYDRISVEKKTKLDTEKSLFKQLVSLFKKVKDRPRYKMAYENWEKVQEAIGENHLPAIILERLIQINRMLFSLKDVLNPLTTASARSSKIEPPFLKLTPNSSNGQSKYANLTVSTYQQLTRIEYQEALDLANQQSRNEKLFKNNEERFDFVDLGDLAETPASLAIKEINEALISEDENQIRKALEETQSIRFDPFTASSIFLFAADFKGGALLRLILNQPQFENLAFDSYQSLMTNARQREKLDVVAVLATHKYFEFLSGEPE